MRFRILHTNMHRGGWGGQPNRILLLSKGLMERGHCVIIAAPKRATLIERAREAGIPTFDDLRFPKKFNPVTFVKEIIKIARLIEENQIQIVHTHGSQDTWIATLAARLLGKRILVIRTRHNTFPVANHLANRLLYRCLIDHVIVVSQGITEVYKSTGVLGHKIEELTTIYSVVEPSRFKNWEKQKKEIEKEFGIGRNTPVVVKVARLAKEKGHIYMLDILGKLCKFLNIKAFALGEGPLKRELKRKKKELKLGCLHFTGLRRDVPGFLGCADLFLFTPISGESLGTAMLEALYMRVPPVTFLVRGVDASIRDGQNGFVVKARDTDKAANRAKLLLLNRRVKQKMGATGKKVIERQFLLNHLICGTERLYSRLWQGTRAKQALSS